jgi:hypothetical protein
VVYEDVPIAMPDAQRTPLLKARDFAIDTKVLDDLSREIAQLKLPPRKIGTLEVTQVVKHPGVNHPNPGADLNDYEYVVRGSACLDSNGRPVANAFWDPGTRTMTLCYGWIAQIENVGRSVIAEGVAHKVVR